MIAAVRIVPAAIIVILFSYSTLPLEGQVVGSAFTCRFLCRGERSGRSLWSSLGLRRERRCCGSTGCYAVQYIVGTYLVEPTSLILVGINVKLNSQVFTVLNVELTDAVLTKHTETAFPGICARNFDYILL